MIHEYFGATGAYEAVLGVSTLFALSSENDDVQDFEVRWDNALLSVRNAFRCDPGRIVQVKNWKILFNFRL